MASGTVRFGAYICTINPRTEERSTREIHFQLPPEAEGTDAVYAKAKAVADKRWKEAYVEETWRC